MTTWKPTAFAKPSILKESSYNFDLKWAVPGQDSGKKTTVHTKRGRRPNDVVPLQTYEEMRLIIEVKISDEQYKLILDRMETFEFDLSCSYLKIYSV